MLKKQFLKKKTVKEEKTVKEKKLLKKKNLMLGIDVEEKSGSKMIAQVVFTAYQRLWCIQCQTLVIYIYIYNIYIYIYIYIYDLLENSL